MIAVHYWSDQPEHTVKKGTSGPKDRFVPEIQWSERPFLFLRASGPKGRFVPENQTGLALQ